MTEPECEWPWHKLNTRKDYRPFDGRSTLTFGESFKAVSKWPVLQGEVLFSETGTGSWQRFTFSITFNFLKMILQWGRSLFEGGVGVLLGFLGTLELLGIKSGVYYEPSCLLRKWEELMQDGIGYSWPIFRPRISH